MNTGIYHWQKPLYQQEQPYLRKKIIFLSLFFLENSFKRGLKTKN